MEKVKFSSNSSSNQKAEILGSFNKYHLAASGYRKAVNLLIEKIFYDGETDSGSLAYPIISNSRNLIINQLKDIYVEKFRVQPCHHNILNLWHDVKEIVKSSSFLQDGLLSQADKIINIFSEIDDITLSLKSFQGEYGNISEINSEIVEFSSKLNRIVEGLRKSVGEKELFS